MCFFFNIGSLFFHPRSNILRSLCLWPFLSSNVLLRILSSSKHFIIFNKLLQYWGIEAEWSSDFCLGGFGSGLTQFYYYSAGTVAFFSRYRICINCDSKCINKKIQCDSHTLVVLCFSVTVFLDSNAPNLACKISLNRQENRTNLHPQAWGKKRRGSTFSLLPCTHNSNIFTVLYFEKTLSLGKERETESNPADPKAETEVAVRLGGRQERIWLAN